MQEGNVVKAYARSNFGLGKTGSATMPALPQIPPNLFSNGDSCQQFSHNITKQQSDGLQFEDHYEDGSEGSQEDEPE